MVISEHKKYQKIVQVVQLERILSQVCNVT